MRSYPTTKEIALGLLCPLSLTRALDPFSIKSYSKAHPARLLWTLQSRILDLIASNRYTHIALPFGPAQQITLNDRGSQLHDTAVTSAQLEILRCALYHTEDIEGDVAEIGSFRGATTVEIATCTSRRVYAIDPFIGYGGSEEDLERFSARTVHHPNITHIRQTSGSAYAILEDCALSLVFIDAVHDVSNSWFDFCVWSNRLKPGGLMVMHDVDDHPGTQFAAMRFLEKSRHYRVWGYCPNMLILERTS